MANHSPGEFQLADSGTPFIYALDADTGVNRFSALVEGGYTRRGKTSAEELMANARLFKAAPKLLFQLERYVALHEGDCVETDDQSTLLREAVAVIKEAKGETT